LKFTKIYRNHLCQDGFLSKEVKYSLNISLNMVKTITIKDDVYIRLLAMKSDESFSELIERIVDERGTEILKKIREMDLIRPEAKSEMMTAIYEKRSEKRELIDNP